MPVDPPALFNDDIDVEVASVKSHGSRSRSTSDTSQPLHPNPKACSTIKTTLRAKMRLKTTTTSQPVFLFLLESLRCRRSNPRPSVSVGVILICVASPQLYLAASSSDKKPKSDRAPSGSKATRTAPRRKRESTPATPVPRAPVVFKALNLKNPLCVSSLFAVLACLLHPIYRSATLRVSSPLSVESSGAAPDSNAILLPPLPANTASGAALGPNTISLPSLPAMRTRLALLLSMAATMDSMM
ncbi:hypothetical protein GALMADRAFT_707027 [Galerina marginata CBS 339.88]|uniref:Uncharacterized protein n=1 Tax=Galerina marginata (strain CBS 339.88) TaxID=685588 RepID=A0A067TZ04_GALM3|nr:hypothetical protein GALMADRAFT_707027 [Galerina marginata CBS 339.88]